MTAAGGMRRLLAVILAGLLLAAANAAFAAASDDPAERLANPAQEARARHLFQQLRCVVCQNESIDDSQAEIAADLRRIVRGQIAAGRTDAQVRDFLVQRYGEFILLRPTLSSGNLALWLAPFALILIGGGYLWIKSRAPAVQDIGLTEEEHIALAAMDAEDMDMLPPHSGLTNAHGAVAIKH
jgi:cytochrome c-type biogenesis protein CcmH